MRRASMTSLSSVDADRLIKDVQNRPAIWDRRNEGNKNKAYIEEIWSELQTLHNVSKKLLKLKWKGLRDNFRCHWKSIPRGEADGLLMRAEDYNAKWQYYKPLLFLSKVMAPIRASRTFSHQAFNNDNSSNYDEHFALEPTIDLIESEDEEDNMSDAQDPSKLLVPMDLQMPLMKILSPHTLAPGHLSPSQSSAINGGLRETSTKRRKFEDPVTTTGGNGNTSSVASNDEYPASFSNHLPVPSDDDFHFLMSLHTYFAKLNGSQKLKLRMKIQKTIFKELFKDDLSE